jgi:hypothetical protein
MRPTFFAMPLLFLAACGPKLSEPMPATSNQKTASTQLTSSVDQVAQIGNKPDNAFALYSTMAALGPLAVDPSAKKALSTHSASPQELSPPGCASGSAATGYTYNNCGSGGTTINGTVKISGTSTTMDLQISASNQGTNIKLSLVGSFSNDGTNFKGDMVYELKLDLGGFGGIPGAGSANQKTTVKYDLTYQKNPVCISSGFIRVDYETAAQTGVAQFEYTGCNTYLVRNG